MHIPISPMILNFFKGVSENTDPTAYIARTIQYPYVRKAPQMVGLTYDTKTKRK